MAGIENNLAGFRRKRGFSAAQLAKLVGSSRQTIYAMEAGDYVPNTLLALKLARALEAGVEDLFALPEGAAPPRLPNERAALLPGSEDLKAGQPVQLCRVGKRLLASSPSPLPWYLPASDAIVAGDLQPPGKTAGKIPGRTPGKTEVSVFHADPGLHKRILVAGCDPAISVLARYVRTSGIELVLAHRNSSQALALLKEGCVHVAGTHLRDEATGESNLAEIGRMFPKNSVALISFAVWEDGIVTAPNNPKGIRGVEDFARADISIVNREAGAGSRRLLDSRLKQLGIGSQAVRGYQAEAPGHLAAAWQVLSGLADCCIATRAAARFFGLGFIPLVSERYDLAIRRGYLDLPGVQALLDTLSRSDVRRELETLGGYDTRAAGRRLL